MRVGAAAAVNAARCQAGTPTAQEKQTSALKSLVKKEETSKTKSTKTFFFLPKGTVPGQLSVVS